MDSFLKNESRSIKESFAKYCCSGNPAELGDTDADQQEALLTKILTETRNTRTLLIVAKKYN